MLAPSFFRAASASVAFALVCSSSALAQFSTLPRTLPPAQEGTLRLAGDLLDNVLVRRSGSSLTVGPTVPPQHLGGFDIVIVPDAGLAANPAALAAFNRAALAWEARISDSITVTINAKLAPLGPGIIGSTDSVILEGGYNTVRDALVADAASDLGDAIAAHLPTAAQFTAAIPAGRTLNGDIAGSKANLKALGFTGLDAIFGVADAEITFSNSFAFDFDHSNGVGAGLLDFETVAAHELGHALGFFSIVDTFNDGYTDLPLGTLDLYRFANNTGADPSTDAQFTTFPRNLIPGVDAITDEITALELRMSTGLTGAFAGTDGRQASHWKDGDLTGTFIGLMDPTLAYGEFHDPQESDFRTLDLIGYDIVMVPEASTYGFGLFALAGVACARRRSRPANVQLA